MKLTIRDDPERLHRYQHIRRSRGLTVARCGATCPGTSHACTREQGHRPPHVAHTFLGRVVAAWDADVPAEASAESRGRVAEARRQSGLPTRRSAGDDGGSLLLRIGARVVRIFADPEALFLFILFVAFVIFGIDWLLRILG